MLRLLNFIFIKRTLLELNRNRHCLTNFSLVSNCYLRAVLHVLFNFCCICSLSNTNVKLVVFKPVAVQTRDR
jgi:hypothetical protein